MSDLNALLKSVQSLSLSLSDEGLAELQTTLDASADLLAADNAAAVAALEAGALTPDAHSLAWVHILNAMRGGSGASSSAASASAGDLPGDNPQQELHGPSSPSSDAFFTLAAMLLRSCDPAQVRKDPAR